MIDIESTIFFIASIMVAIIGTFFLTLLLVNRYYKNILLILDKSIMSKHFAAERDTRIPIQIYRPAPLIAVTVKRLQDLTNSILILISLWPMLCLIAMAVKIGSPGPIFTKQIRIGQYGRRFFKYQFRTTYYHASKDNGKSLASEPLTRVGRVLKKLTLDELPVVFNVLVGDMSFVGRSVSLQEIIDEATPEERQILLGIKPGITSLWAITPASEVQNVKEWIRSDVNYARHWDLWLDLKIMMRTTAAAFWGWSKS